MTQPGGKPGEHGVVGFTLEIGHMSFRQKKNGCTNIGMILGPTSWP